MQWPVNDASLLMSLFFGAHSAGRFLGVPLSFVLKPRTMNIINLLSIVVAYVMLLPVKSLPELLWAAAALSGIGMATTVATTVLWAAESMTISGRVSSVVVASLSCARIIQPQVVGRLFDEPAVGGPMSMVYVLVTAALALCAVFICTLVFVARCVGDQRLVFVARCIGDQRPGNLPDTEDNAPNSTRSVVEQQ